MVKFYLSYLIILHLKIKEVQEKKRITRYSDENGEVLPREPADPAIEHALDVLPVVDPQHLVDNLGDLPILLPSATLDAEAVPGGDSVLADAAHLGGDIAPALVVVDEADQPLLLP